MSFKDEDIEHVTNPHGDALINTTEINSLNVKRIWVEYGRSVGVLLLNKILAMRKKKNILKQVDFPFIGFSIRITYPLGMINFPVVLGVDGRH